MRAYVLKRLLVFIPTLFLITIVVFGVVNAVPAPPQTLSEGQEGTGIRESYLIFHQQFGLDRPVFLNFRCGVTDERVRELLGRLLLDQGDPFSDSARDLSDLGRHAAWGLLSVASDPAGGEGLRDLAFSWLTRSARYRIVPGEDADLRAQMIRENRGIDALSAKPAADEFPREQLANRWRDWLGSRPERFSPGLLERIRISLFETRFAVYLSNLLRLDFGVSMANMQPVLPALLNRLRHSLVISFLAIFLAYLLSIPLGVLSAVLRGTSFERCLSILLFALYSLPTFFAATLLLRFLSIGDPFDWFPSGDVRTLKGFDQLSGLEQLLDRAHHLALPVACLTYGSLAVLSRFTRNSLLEALGSDFVRTARAKGLPEGLVVLRHGLRNALLPLLTLMGNILPAVFSGAVIVEIVFDIPGMGSFIYDAILAQDYNVIMATTLIAAVLTLFGYLLSDLAYAVADPRIALERRGVE